MSLAWACARLCPITRGDFFAYFSNLHSRDGDLHSLRGGQWRAAQVGCGHRCVPAHGLDVSQPVFPIPHVESVLQPAILRVAHAINVEPARWCPYQVPCHCRLFHIFSPTVLIQKHLRTRLCPPRGKTSGVGTSSPLLLPPVCRPLFEQIFGVILMPPTTHSLEVMG